MSASDLTRRSLIAAAGAVAATPALAQTPAPILTKPIPHTGERLGVVGIGTSQVFNFENDPTAFAERTGVLRNLAASGAGRVIDTANAYGMSEARLGDLFAATGLRSQFFLATKCGAEVSRTQQIAMMEESKRRMKTDKFELFQLHNVSNPNQDFGLLREWKAQGICKYVGMSSTSDGAYGAFEQVLAREKPDFIQVDYAIDNRNVEERVLPAAQAAGAAVITALPFGRNRLFNRTQGVALPDFAREIDATTWAQFFLKFLISHPAINVVIPGTDKPEYMLDNLGAGRGRMPDAAMRQRMIAFVDALPAGAQPAGRGGPPGGPGGGGGRGGPPGGGGPGRGG